MINDVRCFMDKFGLLIPAAPTLLDKELFDYRVKFIKEELVEFTKAHKRGDLVEAADGLIDLVYVTLGTALFMGLPWEQLWSEVQRANMSKERAISADQSKRGTALDVIKPEGWVPPQLEQILLEAAGQQRLEGL